MFFFTRFATRELWDAEFRVGDCFVFGSESSGLPREIVGPNHPNALRLPTTPHVRSLNLATTAGIVLYEQQRQLRSAASVSPRASAPPPAQETSG
jgi:tRNA (cytidine/uridine-2'-O-)-methyltransferase